jgi:hypothetical protein
MITRIYLRRDTTENWNNINPVLGSGEVGIEFVSNGTKRIKIGDGNKNWNTLNYFSADINIDEHINNITNAHGIDTIMANIIDINADIENIYGDIDNIRDTMQTIEIVSIKGSVNNYESLLELNTDNLIEGTAYIVESDENRNNVSSIYAIIDNSGNKQWEYIGEFKVDLSDYYNKNEVNTLIENINIPEVNLSDYYNKTEVNDLINDNRVSGLDYPPYWSGTIYRHKMV